MQNFQTEFKVIGAGAWGLRFRNWQQLKSVLGGQTLEDDGAKGPKPEVIPANERRRAPLPVRLAVETSWQALQASGLAAQDLPSVFVSGLGDTQLTDYMCKALASEHKALSPTKFHNSVHNAAAGYWTISTECMQAANSVAAFEHSVPVTLLEALIQCQQEQQPVLLTFYDAPVSEKLLPMLKNTDAFAVSLIVAPLEFEPSNTSFAPVKLQAATTMDAISWPPAPNADSLKQCYENNPTAKVLPLMNLIGEQAPSTEVQLPLSTATSILFRVI